MGTFLCLRPICVVSSACTLGSVNLKGHCLQCELKTPIESIKKFTFDDSLIAESDFSSNLNSKLPFKEVSDKACFRLRLRNLHKPVLVFFWFFTPLHYYVKSSINPQPLV